MPNVQDFYRVPHAVEYFVGIAGDKDNPDVEIVGRVTALRMSFQLFDRFTNAGSDISCSTRRPLP